MSDFSETDKSQEATASEEELRAAEEELSAAEHLTPLPDPLTVPLESPLPPAQDSEGEEAATYRRAIEGVREGAPRETAAEGVALLQRLAADGHAGAQNTLGVLEQRALAKGAADAAPERAFRWYERAAARALPAAAYNVALCYATGTGVFPDADAAFARFTALAAAAGAPAEVELQLGSACERGCGTARDAAAAAQHYRRGAARGNAACMGRLGALCLHGARGVPRDRAEAARWLRRGAELSDATAECTLAEMLLFVCDAHRNGDGDSGDDGDNQNTEPDNQDDHGDARDKKETEREALGLLHAAAARGHAAAYTRLGARWEARGDAALALRYDPGGRGAGRRRRVRRARDALRARHGRRAGSGDGRHVVPARGRRGLRARRVRARARVPPRPRHRTGHAPRRLAPDQRGRARRPRGPVRPRASLPPRHRKHQE